MIRWFAAALSAKSEDFNGEDNQWLVIHWLVLPTRCSTDEYCSWLIDLWYRLLGTSTREWLMSEQYFRLDAIQPDTWRQEFENEHKSTDGVDVWKCSMVFQYAVFLFYWPRYEVIAVWRLTAFHRNFYLPLSAKTELHTCNLVGARRVDNQHTIGLFSLGER